MTDTVNKHGLNRTIDAATKRIIRQRCGFGCVNCGCAIYQYEHVDPPFSEALEHDPEKIVLLCGGCHDRVTRGLLAKGTVAKKALSPKCKTLGYSYGPLDVSENAVNVTFGIATFINVRQILSVMGDNIFSITRPLNNDEPLLINAFLCDAQGQEILKIEDNEWKSSTENWDVEVVGKRISIRSALGKIALIFRAESPGELVIEQLSMAHKGATIECREGQNFSVTTPAGQKLFGQALSVVGCDVGVLVTKSGMMFGIGGGSTSLSGTISIQSPSNRPTRKERIGRNDPCPCGKPARYKVCCGKLQ